MNSPFATIPEEGTRRIRELLEQIPKIPWFQNVGGLPDNVMLFETSEAAGNAAKAASGGAVWNADSNAAWDVVWDDTWVSACDASRDAALLAGIHACDGLDIAPEHVEHAERRWAVWCAGYGVWCDVGGLLYAYKKP